MAKKVNKKEMSQLTKIIIGLLLGVIVGCITNAYGFKEFLLFSLLGKIYIFALKAIAPILVLCLVVDSISSMNRDDAMQRKGIGLVLILYLVSSLVASFIAIITSTLYPCIIPGLEKLINNKAESLGGSGSLLNTILSIVENPVAAIINGNYLAILFWAILTGVLVRKASKETRLVIHDIAMITTDAVQIIVKFAPIAVFGLIYSSLVRNGITVFYDYGKLIILLVVSMSIVAFITNPIIVGICIKGNPYPLLFRCLRDSAINAFVTRSSAANIPINLDLCKKMKLNEKVYNITIPLGATVNMAGAASVITCMAICTCYTLGKAIPLYYTVPICFVATLAAAGTAGTAGGSLMLIPFACSLFGIPSDVAWYTVGVGQQISFVQDSVETAINSSSDVLFTATADIMIKEKVVTTIKKLKRKKHK